MTRSQSRFGPLLVAALLAGSLLMGSCASVSEKESPVAVDIPEPSSGESTQEMALAMYNQELRIPLWEEPPLGLPPERTPALTISLDLVDLSGTPGGTDTQRTETLERLFRDTFYRGLSPQDYAREVVRVQTIEYRDMGEEARNNSRIALSETLNWTYDEQFEGKTLPPRLLVIARNRANYTGGAHGNYDKRYFVFDQELGMRIFLADLVRDDAMPALQDLVNRELRTAKKLGPRDSLKKALFLVDKADLTENYFLSSQGLGFHWDPYEIAPYAEGSVEVLVPYKDLETLVRPEGQRLIRALGNN
jgi:hypothetical protein